MLETSLMGLKMLDLVLPDQGCLVFVKADEGGCCKAKKFREDGGEVIGQRRGKCWSKFNGVEDV